jgi:hypothetical protein
VINFGDIMKASELIKILEIRPDAEVLIIAGKDRKTYVVDGTVPSMAHTVFIIGSKTPYEYENESK